MSALLVRLVRLVLVPDLVADQGGRMWEGGRKGVMDDDVLPYGARAVVFQVKEPLELWRTPVWSQWRRVVRLAPRPATRVALVALRARARGMERSTRATM
jgi:hypothetical protein